MEKYLCTVGLLFFVYCSVAQQTITDSIFRLPAVVKTADRLNAFGSTKSLVHLDSLETAFSENDNLADRLDNLPVSIKSYGAGSLSTISIRGKGAGHTAVVWEGFNLQNAMNGVVDLSLIPTVLFNDLTLQLGSGSAMFGSGAVGGAIHLNNRNSPEEGSRILVGASLGSFNDYRQWADVLSAHDNWEFSVKGFRQTARNDFAYENPVLPGQPRLRLENAFMKNESLLSTASVNLAKNHQLSLNFWYQKSNREIPPSLTEISSEAFQKDEAVRSFVSWKATGNNSVFQLRTGYFNEYIGFTDPEIELVAENRSKNLVSEAEYTIFPHPLHRINFGIGQHFVGAETDNYSGKVSQSRSAVFSSYRVKNRPDNLSVTLSVREELIDGKLSPLTFSMGMKATLNEKIYLNGNFGRTYRTPTFNDLYWVPGGNPDLLPESGLDMDLGIQYQDEKPFWGWSAGAVIFNSQVRNWIQWLPNEQGIWRPDNVLEVWSRGLEQELSVRFNNKKQWLVQFNARYAFIASTNKKTGLQQEDAIDKQLIYVPRHNLRASLQVGFWHFRLRYLHQIISKRFTTSDNENFIGDFQLGELDLSQSFAKNNHSWRIHFKINNVWNAYYEKIAFRPMPGRHFQLSIIYTFKKFKPNAYN